MPESDAVIREAADLERLLGDAIPESLQLEYKSGRPKNKDKFKDDIAQDISAFANSAGGTLIIGVVEEQNRPVRIDGVDENQFSRESLGQLLASKIHPIIPGLRIQAIRTSNEQTALVVTVPASRRAPHQGPNHKYYRRYEFHNQPMAHHEIEDVRRRQISVTPLVIVNPVPRGVLLAAVDVRNVGQYPAKDISFQFSAPSVWPKNDIPAPLRNGIAYLGPGQHLRFRAESFAKLLSEQAVTSTFEVTIEYTHGQLEERMTHVWPLDFEAYRDSMSIITDEQEVRRDTKDELKKLRESVERIRSWFDDSMTRLVGANGLDLSIYTLRNMQKLAAGLDVEKLSPYWWSASDFRKALSIEFELAMALETLFQCNRQIAYEEVAAVAGMTPALLHRFSATFELSIMSIAAEGEETAPLA